MSTELDRELGRLYAALGRESQVTPLASPELLRKRGDRQARTRTALTLAAAALVVAGVVGGGSLLLNDDTKVQPAPPGPTPTVSATPTEAPSPTPSGTPSSSPSTSSTGTRTNAAKPPPTVVPKTAFLTGAELNGDDMSKYEDSFLPELCGKGWNDSEPRVSSVQGGQLRPEDADPTEVPQANFQEAIVVWRSAGQAESWMSGLRDTVRSCPSEDSTTIGGKVTYELVTDAPVTGDDWLVIHRTEPAYDFASGDSLPGAYDFYTASVRHGDTIVTFNTTSWENYGIDDPARFYELVGIGSERVATWRNGTT